MQDPGTQALARMIRRERENAQLTQAELASRIGVPQSFVSKCESGERRIGVLDLRRICVALGTEAGDFIRRFDAADPEYQR
jgi:transcriptional regulator with XRE-family HTH domain